MKMTCVRRIRMVMALVMIILMELSPVEQIRVVIVMMGMWMSTLVLSNLDGVDSTVVDGEADAVDILTLYLDSDKDEQGTPDTTIENCEQQEGYVENADDCDDNDATCSWERL